MAYGRMLQRGLPFDVERFEILQTHWELFRDALIDEVDPKRLVVSDTGEFRDAGFDTLIRQLGLHPVWPRTRTGKFKRDQDALRAHRDLHPAIDPDFSVLSFRLGFMRVSAGYSMKSQNNQQLVRPSCTFKASYGMLSGSQIMFVEGTQALVSIWPAPLFLKIAFTTH